MKKMILSLGVALLALCGCKETSSVKESEGRIVVDITQPEKNLKMSDLFSDIKYVKLETTKESLIKYIKKVLNFDGKLLVVDGAMNSLLLFDKDGRFIKKIAGQGKGPGEYAYLTNATVDKKGKRLFILDDFSSHLLTYDFEGNYLESIKLDFKALDLEYLGNDKLVFYCGYRRNDNYLKEDARPSLFVYDLKQSVVTPLQYVSNKVASHEMASPSKAISSCGDGKVWYGFDLTNEFLVINKGELEHSFTLDFGKEDTDKRLAFVKRLEDEDFDMKDIRNIPRPKHMSVFSTVKTADYLLVSMTNFQDGYDYLVVYSPESGKCFVDKKKWDEPLYKEMKSIVPTQFYSSEENKFYGSVMPDKVLSIDDTDNEALKELKEGLQEDDNPIVIVVETKPL